tara:strand:- start:333 stop:905 length:573 start_codon:yes stop_codon:yes gene_type:complete
MCLGSSKNNLLLFAVIPLFIIGSCKKANVQEFIEKFEIPDSFQVEIAHNVELQYADSGVLNAKIFADTMKRYPLVDSPYLELIGGVKANFYDKKGKSVISSLHSEYGKSQEESQIITVQDQVVLTNIKDETLLTSELHWNQKSKKIYTDKFVTIIRNQDTINGIGLESNETFSKYSIKRIKGQINQRNTK